MQAQARQMKLAALGRLTANIAHEVRNPLGAISHAAELLQEEPAINDTTRRLITIIHENSQRLDRMVNDVLRLNRGERAHRERFKLVDFLKTFVEQFCPDREDRPRDLRDRARRRPRRAVRPQPPEPGDVEPVPQRAAPLPARASASIRIRVALEPRGAIVKLDVIDDGPGVRAGGCAASCSSRSSRRPPAAPGSVSTSRAKCARRTARRWITWRPRPARSSRCCAGLPEGR